MSDEARAKTAMRRRVLKWRRQLDPSLGQRWSQQACRRLQESPLYARASALVAYRAFDSEADPSALVQQALKDGKAVGLPRVDGAQLRLHRYAGEPLEANRWGVQEPAVDAPLLELERVALILIPAVAVDADGGRLGFGKGYYDRLLPTLTGACRVGFVFASQRQAAVPMQEHDVRLQWIASEEELLRVAP